MGCGLSNPSPSYNQSTSYELDIKEIKSRIKFFHSYAIFILFLL